MNKILLALAISSLLAGCAGTYEWTKPGMTPAARDNDLMACGTRNAHLDKDDPNGVIAIDECMKVRGYEKAAR